MNTDSFADRVDGWFGRLQKRCGDPGFRAALRHWLSDAGRPRAYQALMEVRGTLDDHDFNTIAALYAYHPDDNPGSGGIGALCRGLSRGFSTFEGRFKRLLVCSAAELHQHLQPIVLAARARSIPVNYRQLYLDLRSWDRDFHGDQVRQRWATEFWSEEANAARAQEGGTA